MTNDFFPCSCLWFPLSQMPIVQGQPATLCIPCVYLEYTLCVPCVFQNTQGTHILYFTYTYSTHKYPTGYRQYTSSTRLNVSLKRKKKERGKGGKKNIQDYCPLVTDASRSYTHQAFQAQLIHFRRNKQCYLLIGRFWWGVNIRIRFHIDDLDDKTGWLFIKRC